MPKIIFTLSLLMFCVLAKGTPRGSNALFQENKGQVTDQHYAVRNDILFYGSTAGLSFYLKKDGISYQLYKQHGEGRNNEARKLPGIETNVPDTVTIQRLDVTWLGANTDAPVSARHAATGHNNYYLAHCPSGVMNVKNYREVEYRNLYNKIDLKYYSHNGCLKYDYIVHPGGNPASIRLQIAGADAIMLNEDGSVSITTPLGIIKEEAPVAYQEGRKISTAWKVNGNTLSFVMESYDKKKLLVIDPLVREWSTYYGGNGGDGFFDCVADAYGNVYATGLSESLNNIASTGAQQVVYAGTGDCMLTKFNAAGSRLWGTYYGGTGGDMAVGVLADLNGDIYMYGDASDGTFPVTAGAYQAVYGGGANDGIIVKFDTGGARIWASFYGGSGADGVSSMAMDSEGNLYLCGITFSTATFATPGAFQTTLGGTADGFLAKHNSSFAKIWGTYYGGTAADHANGVFCKGDKLYLFGGTTSTNNIATPGAYQTSFSGGFSFDAYLVQFDTSGARNWGTYYSAVPGDYENVRDGIATDSGYAYIVGQQGSNNGFLVKFNANGANIWVHTTNGVAEAVTMTANGNIVTGGTTVAISGIATPGAFQPAVSTASDAFVREVTPGGALVWGSYMGGSDNGDKFNGCMADGNGNIYFVGGTTSANNIADANAFQGTYGGGANDGMITRFSLCPPAAFAPELSAVSSAGICSGDTAILSTPPVAGASYVWTRNGAIVPGSSPTLNATLAGTYHVYVVAGGCPARSDSVAITVTPSVYPSIALMVSGTNLVAAGQPVTINATLTSAGPSYSIEWRNKNVPFATTTIPTVTYTKQPGTDTITALLSVPLSCYDTALSNHVRVYEAVSVGTLPGREDMSIYPNPFDERVTITGAEEGDRLVLMDALGRIVAEHSLSPAVGSISVFHTENIAPGLYVCYISSKDGVRLYRRSMLKL